MEQDSAGAGRRRGELQQGAGSKLQAGTEGAMHALWIDRVAVGAERLEQDSAECRLQAAEAGGRAQEAAVDPGGNRRSSRQQAGEMEEMGCTLAMGQGCGPTDLGGRVAQRCLTPSDCGWRV